MSEDTFLTVREALMEIRGDVKVLIGQVGVMNELKADVEDLKPRVAKLEASGLRISGAWAAIGVVTAAFAGLAGLALGASALFFN